MSIDPVSGFEIFNDIPAISPKYPKPLSNIKLNKGSYPTNSWFQNAVTDSVDNFNRFANVMPWYWQVYYDSNKIGLSHSNKLPFVNVSTNGNLQQIEAQPVPGIMLSIEGKESSPMFMNNFDDYTALFSDAESANNSTFTAHPCRGSPFATFKYTGANNVKLDFLTFGITNISGVTGITGAYIITTLNTRNTEMNTGFDNVGSLSKQLKQLSFFDSYQSLNSPITATAEYRSAINYNSQTNSAPPSPTQLNVNALNTKATYIFNTGVNNQGGKFVFDPPNSATGTADGTNISIKYNVPGDIKYTIRTNLDWDQLPQIMTAVTEKVVTDKWLLYGPLSIRQVGNGIIFSGYKGPIQLAAIDNDEQLSEYIKYLGNYIIGGESSNFNVNGGFSINYNRVGSSQLLMLPNHWDSFNLSGLSYIHNLQPYINIIYGDLKYYKLSSDSISLTPKSFSLPPLVDLSKFTASQKSALITQVDKDAKFLADPERNFFPPSDPYAFGQIAGTVARLIIFAKELGTLNTVNIQGAIKVLKQYLVAWLTNTNISGIDAPCACPSCGQSPPGLIPASAMFHLQRETKWSGIIVPADYLHSVLPNCYPLGSFGNSFYNDHHFHWGYILYALNSLEYIGEGLSGQYRKQITAIIKDIVNPNSDSAAWKTRFKDWYGGHSWATGNTTETARQQESCGEAINGYYGAYLMSQALNDQSLQSCASVCLNLEIQACHNYYYLQAPNIKLGLINQAKGLGIIFNNSKQFTLDWGMQPDSFPGRSLGIYGIQTVPFTDISKIQIPESWSSLLPSPNPEIGLAYSITPSLVSSLCGTSPYRGIGVYDTEWKTALPFDVEREGSFWGLVGLKMLSYGVGIDNITARRAYSASLNNQQKFMDQNGQYFPITKQFDSYSNTLYWLITTGKWNTSGVSSVVLNHSPLQPLNISTNETDCSPLPLPSKRELLESSTLRDQGLVNVPTIIIKVCFNKEQNNISKAFFQIRDDRLYYYNRHLQKDCSNCKINEKGCIIHGICPEDVRFTRLDSTLNITKVINAPGNNLYEKVDHLGGNVDPMHIVAYAYLKLILSRTLYGKFSLKYLTQRYNNKFFRNLADSRFCNFVNAFIELGVLDYNKYFIN